MTEVTEPADREAIFTALPGLATANRSSARLSADGVYRYSLTRSWGEGAMATFIMLNPSTADETQDDPTIRRCTGFAKQWGCAGLHVINIYAFRATDPTDLWCAGDPIGPDNDWYLSCRAVAAQENHWPLIAAWGANAKPGRVAEVRALPGMAQLVALGVTKSGAPKHPLYLRSDSALSPWSWSLGRLESRGWKS